MAIATIDKKRLRGSIARHPWVYKDSVTDIQGEVEDGGIVEVRAPDGRFVAWAFINHASRLFLRLYSFQHKDRDPAALFKQRLRQAIALRRDILRLDERADAYRIVHSEGDGIPGLILDRYKDHAVISCTALGTYRVLQDIVDETIAALGLAGVFETGSAKGLRGIEGLPPGRGVIAGSPPPLELEVQIDGLRQKVNITGGQKTGLFLDQRDTIRRFAELCRGARVLDACCYGGAFGLMALKHGAASAAAFDISNKAVERSLENARLNQLQDRYQVERQDLFSAFKKLRDDGARFDRIIFDPPNFAGRRKDIKNARKAYLEAHALALSILEPGGLLLSCSCSHHLDEAFLEASLAQAARRQKTPLQILERRGAGPDHPQDVACPEGRYLKAIIARSARDEPSPPA